MEHQREGNDTIQIKVSFNEELRRIPFTSTDYKLLENELRQLFQIPQNNSVIVQYQDGEGDWITMSSSEEFAHALVLTKNQVLRIKVQIGNVERIGERPFVAQHQGFYDMRRNEERERRPEERERKYEDKGRRFEEKRKYRDQDVDDNRLGRTGGRFVQHVSIPDDFLIYPNTNFTKTWRFRNDSNVPWPIGCQIVCVGKKTADRMNGPETVTINTETVSPGSTVDVSVPLISPNSIGKFTGYWRLAEPNGKKFGQRVRVQIEVIRDQIASANNNPFYPVQNSSMMHNQMQFNQTPAQFNQTTPNPVQYQLQFSPVPMFEQNPLPVYQNVQNNQYNQLLQNGQLQWMLNEMNSLGFTDVATNLTVLRQFDGDLSKAVLYLEKVRIS
eukprot:TRINITY_DN5794_c0_g1_i1.p1 TRINITY_DN5794_c0_g1~~TRINITY_DN5794_c0_g1_i1.p1  ORF type:complete len:386 (-),score=86.34 TRINITY_DN5794_c0_g1_i1:86-1243(-)